MLQACPAEGLRPCTKVIKGACFLHVLQVQKVVQDPSLLTKFGHICPSRTDEEAWIEGLASLDKNKFSGQVEEQATGLFLTI